MNSRTRRSDRADSSDADADVNVGNEANKKAIPGKDFRIPKKRNSGPVVEPEAAGSNPLTSPKTEKKFELVEDALEAMFAGVSGNIRLYFFRCIYRSSDGRMVMTVLQWRK